MVLTTRNFPITLLASCAPLVCTLILSDAMVIPSSPPRSPLQVKGTTGGNVTLRCPVPFKTEFVLWSKEDDPGPSLELSFRHRIMGRGGTLRIFDLVSGDAGRYICKAVSGHESLEAHVNLLVLSVPENSRERLSNDYPEHTDTGKPRFRMDKPLSTWVQRPVGSVVRFKCEAEGKPHLEIQWLKNRQRIEQGDRKRTRWTLTLVNLKENDSGLYTCIVSNHLGSISTNFTLQVITSASDEKPEIMGSDPSNVTLAYGNTTNLQCRSRSKTLLQIQWLKKVEQSESVPVEDRPFQIDNDYYRVLKNHHTMLVSPPEEGIYLSKLKLGPVNLESAGTYVCVAHNVQGFFAYRAASVDVLSMTSTSEFQSAEGYVLTSVLVAVSVLILFVLARFSLTLYRSKKLCLSRTKTQIEVAATKIQHQELSPAESLTPAPTLATSVSAGRSSARHKHYHHHHHRHQHHLLASKDRRTHTLL